LASLSIVTPVLNSRDYLEQLLESVAALVTPHEHLVIDGASTDGTIELLEKCADPGLTWVSERDRGQTDAVNKGLARVSGDYVNWVNADNVYRPDAVDRAVGLLDADPELMAVFGGIDIIDEAGRLRRRYIPGAYSWQRYLFLGDYLPTETIIFRRSLLEDCGLLDPRFEDAADYDFYLRLLHRRRVGRIAEPLLLYRYHPGSKTARDPWLAQGEHRVIREQWARGPRDRAIMVGFDRLKRAVLPRISPWPRPYPEDRESSTRAARASTAAGSGRGPQNQR
jgi:glycosyltransferase involved in cell wall biosynthesis